VGFSIFRADYSHFAHFLVHDVFVYAVYIAWCTRAKCPPAGLECRAVVVDVTGLKREEDKVRVSEIHYRRLFEAAHDGVLFLDPGTRKITDANPFMTKLLGYPQDQLVGKELFEIGLLKDETASQEMFEKLKKKREVRYEDQPLETQAGRQQEVEVVARPVAWK
jgi:PAS domain S-box-containing protein